VWLSLGNYYRKRGEVFRREDVPYVAGSGDPKHRLDLYLPKQGPTRREGREKPPPIVVFVHGDYERADRRLLQPLTGVYGNVGVALASAGLGAAILSYRQYPRAATAEDSYADVARAVATVHAEADRWRVDRSRIFVMGHSAGGQLVACLALDPRIVERHGVDPALVRGFISASGVYDVRRVMAFWGPRLRRIVRALHGPTDEALDAGSPLTLAHAEHPPLLLIGSDADLPELRESFLIMKRRLTELGGPAVFSDLKGVTHRGMIVRMGTRADPTTPEVVRFIRRCE
jgi:acetyl esterase/lipase